MEGISVVTIVVSSSTGDSPNVGRDSKGVVREVEPLPGDWTGDGDVWPSGAGMTRQGEQNQGPLFQLLPFVPLLLVHFLWKVLEHF